MYNTKAKFVKHIACEQCGSSDANSLYEDGNQYCFSCENFISGRNKMIQNNVTKAPIQGVINNVFTKGEYSALQGRGIKQEVCRKFGVTVTDSGKKHIYPYYDQDKNHTGNKIREVEPIFNRAVLFDTTQNSWHGFPEPIHPPAGKMRKSFAVYYMTDITKTAEERYRAHYVGV